MFPYLDVFCWRGEVIDWKRGVVVYMAVEEIRLAECRFEC